MTRKDYSAIQRNLGFIEGVLICLDDDRGALDRIIAINSILEKEVLTMNEYIKKTSIIGHAHKLAFGRILTDREVEVVEMVVNDAPAADVAPVRHGRWFHSFGGWLCSECNDQAPFWCMASTQNLSNYCPNCGAKMDGGDERNV